MAAKGKQRYVDCRFNCGIWTSVWIPNEVDVSTMQFACGFCAHKELMLLQDRVNTLESTALPISDVETKVDQLSTRITDVEAAQHTPPNGTLENRIVEVYNTLRKKERIEEEKEPNIIVSGLEVQSPNQDWSTATALLNDLGINTNVLLKVDRVGKVKSNKQLLRLKLCDVSTKWGVIKQAKTIRQNPKWNGIYLNLDLTREQQVIEYELRNRLKEIRKDRPNEKHFIRNGQIVSKT